MILAKINYLDENAIENTLYLSSEPFVSSSSDNPPNQPFADYILSGGQLTRRVTESLYGYSTVGIGALEIFATPELMNLSENINVNGQAVTLYYGESYQKLNDLTELSNCVGLSLQPNTDNTLQLKFKDSAEKLDVALTEEGSPHCYGRVFNIEPSLIDAANLEYQVHAGEIENISDVRDGGLSVEFEANLTNGTFTLISPAQGLITCDVDGCKVDGKWLQSATDIIPSLLIQVGFLDNHIIDLPDYLLGIYVNSDETLSSVLDQISESLMGYWRFNRFGEFEFKQLQTDITNSSAILDGDVIKRGTWRVKQSIEPAKEITVSYKKNFTVQTDGFFSSVTTESREVFGKDEETEKHENVLEQYPNAEVLYFSTLLVEQVDAFEIAKSRLLFSSKRRRVYTSSAVRAAFEYNVGDVVKLSNTPQSSGANGIVLGLIDDALADVCEVEVVV
jgi:hypothetical protein